MPRGAGESAQGQGGAGVARFLANPASFYQMGAAPYFTPGSYSPTPGYVPTKSGANNENPAPVASAGAPSSPAGPMGGQPNINAPVGSYEWWTAYNPGADYSRHFGGGGR